MKKKLAWFGSLPLGIAIRLFLLYVVRRIIRLPITFTFSEFSEDTIIHHYPFPKPGTYVDVGCNEPILFSNTFNLYLEGWRGINIDANKDLIKKFKRIRKKDISICTAVSDSSREVFFYKAKNNLVSTIDEGYYTGGGKWWDENLEEKEKVTTETLTSVLDKNLKPGQTVDVLSIDVEGHDYNVLIGLDIKKYRPKIIIIECRDLETISENPINTYLNKNDFLFRAFSGYTGIYIDKSMIKTT